MMMMMVIMILNEQEKKDIFVGYLILLLKNGKKKMLVIVLCKFVVIIKVVFHDLQAESERSVGRFHVLFLFFVSLMFGISLISLFCYHIFLTVHNRSTLGRFVFVFFLLMFCFLSSVVL